MAHEGPRARDVTAARLARLFAEADELGSSTSLAGRWGQALSCYEVPGGPGVLPRELLRVFADLMFPGYPHGPEVVRSADLDEAAIVALLEPFED